MSNRPNGGPVESAEDEGVKTREPSPTRTVPPAVPGEYKPAMALEDIPGIQYALEEFLASHMLESEEHCHSRDPRKERLYYASGYGLIQCVKALMSFDDDDILAAIGHTKHGNLIASRHRKRQGTLLSPTRLAGMVMGSSANFVKNMTDVERHAELVYAETLFEKAILGIVYSGDWLAFIKEALNMRTTISIYRQLGKYIETSDAAAPGGEDTSIDPHFRSGVYLGLGVTNLVLTLLPSRVLSIAEILGYKGDRYVGLAFLQRAGGWSKEGEGPAVSIEEEGVRRSLCDMVLLIFHLVLSSFTFDGVDVRMAQKVLNWNAVRYPNGVFFLFGQGRVLLRRSQPKPALRFYQRAMRVQDQYRNLHHISFWEMAIANFSLWDIPGSLSSWNVLEQEATWSKACYTYGMAVCLLESGDASSQEQAAQLMDSVSDRRQRIAGKSIPIEKFVARKARKFQTQNRRLVLAALEFAYMLLALAYAPREALVRRHLPLVEEQLLRIPSTGKEIDSRTYDGGEHSYWDDLCLARFLEGVCLRYIAYPDPDALLDTEASQEGPTREVAQDRAETAFNFVLEHGSKIVYDHYLVYHAHYELGRLLARKGDADAARRHLDVVLSGKSLESNPSARKGKYSMENALVMRTNAALESMDQNRQL